MCAKVLKRIERIFTECRMNNVRLCRDDVNAGRGGNGSTDRHIFILFVFSYLQVPIDFTPHLISLPTPD